MTSFAQFERPKALKLIGLLVEKVNLREIQLVFPVEFYTILKSLAHPLDCLDLNLSEPIFGHCGPGLSNDLDSAVSDVSVHQSADICLDGPGH